MQEGETRFTTWLLEIINADEQARVKGLSSINAG
jgi:hypothetical protein